MGEGEGSQEKGADMSDTEKGKRGLGRVYLRGRTYWIQYSFRGQKVRESSESEKEQSAIRLLKKRLGEIGRGHLVGPQVERTTFADLEKLIKDDYALNGRRSAARLNSALPHLREYFGMTRAVDITFDRLTAYARERQEGESPPAPATVKYELAIMKHAFTLAVKAGRLVLRPPFPTITVDNTRKGFFEEADFRAVCERLPEDLHPLAEFGYLTGWRVEECRSLEWPQVDLEAGWVRLEPGTTKNAEGRAFPLRPFPALESLLKRQRERTDAAEVEHGRIIPWVFHRDGERIGSFRKTWDSACKDAGVPGRLFHDLRRTAVRNLERSGVSRSAAMKLTGHKTESVYRRYAIVAESDLVAAVAKRAAYQKKLAAQVRTVIPMKEAAKKVRAQNGHNFPAIAHGDGKHDPQVSEKIDSEWCRGTELNRRRRDFQSLALPTELPRHPRWDGAGSGGC